MDKPPYEPNADEKDLAEQMLTPTEEEFSLERAASQTKLENAGLKGYLNLEDDKLEGEIDQKRIKLKKTIEGKFIGSMNDVPLTEENAEKLFWGLKPYAQDISGWIGKEIRRRKEIIERTPPQDEIIEEIMRKASRKEK